jgi:hypothetical protein
VRRTDVTEDDVFNSKTKDMFYQKIEKWLLSKGEKYSMLQQKDFWRPEYKLKFRTFEHE